MSGRLLDTNIVIALFAQDQSVTEKLAEVEEVFVPSIVLGKLYFGAHRSARAEDNISRLDEFAERSAILHCDRLTAKHYGQIKHKLKVGGTPIPENDIWISALSQQFNLTLITRDKHFSAVDGLKL